MVLCAVELLPKKQLKVILTEYSACNDSEITSMKNS